MQTINPSYLQTFNDLAIQYYGSVVYATDIAHANGLCITDDLPSSVILPDIETTADDKTIVRNLQKLNLNIASKYPL